jgi:hypothetical protein
MYHDVEQAWLGRTSLLLLIFVCFRRAPAKRAEKELDVISAGAERRD